MVSNIKIKNLEELLKNANLDGKIVGQKVTNLTAPGENYCSMMLKLDLEIEKSNGQKEDLHAVAKCLQASQKVQHMNMMSMEKEVGFYTNVVPIVEEFMRENGINENLFCKMYGGRVDGTDTVTDTCLILENLVIKGYKNEDRYVGFDLETSKLIVKKLAIFHAVFMGLKSKKPDIYESKIKQYLKRPGPPGLPPQDGLPPPNGPPDGKPPGVQGVRGPPPFLGPDGKPRGPPPGPLNNPQLIKALEQNEETKKLMPKLKEIAKMKPFEDQDSENPTPEIWNSVNHSDFWVNNVMINLDQKYEEQVKIVDFQIIHEACFTKDLVFFLFTSVQTPVQKQSFEELLRYYYEEFTKTLKILQLDLPLSYEEYQNLLKRTAKFELNHALMFTNVIFGDKNLEHDLMSDENFDPFEFMGKLMSGDIKPIQMDKIFMIVTLAGKFDWL